MGCANAGAAISNPAISTANPAFIPASFHGETCPTMTPRADKRKGACQATPAAQRLSIIMKMPAHRRTHAPSNGIAKGPRPLPAGGKLSYPLGGAQESRRMISKSR